MHAALLAADGNQLQMLSRYLDEPVRLSGSRTYSLSVEKLGSVGNYEWVKIVARDAHLVDKQQAWRVGVNYCERPNQDADILYRNTTAVYIELN